MMWVFTLFAIFAFWLGRWGSVRAADLVPPTFSGEGRLKQQRVIQRGAITLQVMGVVFFLFFGMAAIATAL